MSRVYAAFTLIALAFCPVAASGQESNLIPDASANLQAPPGWSFTPSFTYAGGWDDNVIIRGEGDATPADFVNVINPRAALDLNGRRGQISAYYDGAFFSYRDLGQLNSYDQHASFFGRRRLSSHVALFARNIAASVPTTELSQFIAVPFVRTGSRLDELTTGLEAAFTKRTSIVASYVFQWVDFDHTQLGSESLLGGHSHGGTVVLKHRLNERLTLTGDYELHHAIIGEAAQTFDVQNWLAGGDYRLSESTHVFAAAGLSRLAVTEFSAAQTGPALRAGLTRQLRAASLDLLYSRSFVPAYGFGGTVQNEEATARIRVPFDRRFYTTSALSWRRNDPLTGDEFPLQSYWIEGSIGYAATPWVHLEAFYEGTHQTIDRPGGTLNRNRIGFQVTTAKPVRIQ
jgi:hypothetical protein